MEFKAILMGMCTLACSMHSVAAGTPAAEPVAEEVTLITPPEEKQDESNLDQFGFAPAFFYIVYDEEVLSDSKDVRLRGDGTIHRLIRP